MFGSLGAPEFIIIGVVLILLFGVGKISGLGKELGSSIKEFRKAVKDEDEDAAKKAQAQQQTQYAQQQQPQYQQPPQQYQQPPVQAPPPQAQQAPPPPQQQTGDKNPNIF